jgi:hypothetical protein
MKRSTGFNNSTPGAAWMEGHHTWWTPRVRDPLGQDGKPRPHAELVAIRKARREYLQAARVSGMSDPASEGLRGYAESAAGGGKINPLDSVS